MVIVTDDEDPFETGPGFGRTKFQTLMNQQGMRFTNFFGPHSLCAPFRAVLMTGQYEQNNKIAGNSIWKGSRPAGPPPTVDPSDTTVLLTDFTKTVYSALWGRVGSRNVQVGTIGKFINTWSGAQDAAAIFVPTGTDRFHMLSFNEQNKGGGTISSNGYQSYDQVSDADGNVVTAGVNASGASVYAGTTLQNQHVHDWMADRFDDTIEEFVGRANTDARYGLPFAVFVYPNAPHSQFTPLPSQGAGIDAATKTDRQTREGFYSTWIPPFCDYRALRIKATGGTLGISYKDQSVTVAWNVDATTLQASLESLSTIGAGNVTVTGGGTQDGEHPFTITIVGNDPPNVTPLIVDTTTLVGDAVTAFPTIDLNDPVIQGPTGLYGGNPGTNVDTERKRMKQMVGVDDLIDRIVTKLDAHGLLATTDVLYLADNGTYSGNGAHYKNSATDQKDNSFDADLLIPFVARGPDFPANTENSAPVSAIELYPWIVNLFGATANRTIDHVSFQSAIANAHANDQTVFRISGIAQDGVRVGRWKYWEDTQPRSQQQAVAVSGATGGTYTLTFYLPVKTVDGAGNCHLSYSTWTTANLSPTLTAAQFKAALYAVGQGGAPSPFNSTTGDIATVTLAATTYKITFGGNFQYVNWRPFVADITNLTGSSPYVQVTVEAAGDEPVNLFDVLHDPFEACNLHGVGAFTAAHPTLETNLASLTASLQTCAGSSCQVSYNGG